MISEKMSMVNIASTISLGDSEIGTLEPRLWIVRRASIMVTVDVTRMIVATRIVIVVESPLAFVLTV